MFTLLDSTPDKGRCRCVFGYKESGTHNWNLKDGRKNEGFTGACILDSNVNPNSDNWSTGITIGAIVGGVGIAAIIRYKCSSCQSVGPNYEDGLSSARNSMSTEDSTYETIEVGDDGYLSPGPGNSNSNYLSSIDDGYLDTLPSGSGASGGSPTEELELNEIQIHNNAGYDDDDSYVSMNVDNTNNADYIDAYYTDSGGNNSTTPFSGEGGEEGAMELRPLSSPSDPNNQPPNEPEAETNC